MAMNVKSIKDWTKKIWNNSVNWVSKNRVKSLVISLLIFLIIILIINLSWECCWPPVLGKTKTGGECEIGTLIVQLRYAIGGVIGLLAVVIASERSRALDKTAEAQIETVKAQEKRNIQERFKNASKQLVEENPNVRLEGAYELYYLAIDSEYRLKYICDRLCRHIRDLTTSKAVVGKTTDDKESYSERYKDKPSDEVQSILDLLTNKDSPFKSDQINLETAYLNGANLRRAQLQRANLKAAHLQGAYLSSAQLQRANLREAQLQGADLSSAQLQGANLREAQLQWANLRHAQLQEAKLWHSQLQGAKLLNAQLQGAYLLNTQLQGANLRHAQLQEAKLLNAQLQGADLSSAQLQGANLRHAQLQEVDLYKTQLQGANLTESQLQGANLDKTDFRGAFTEKDIGIRFAIDQLKARINKKNNIKGVTFSGGVTAEQLENFKNIKTETLDKLVKITDYDQYRIKHFKRRIDKVEKILEDNIGKPPIFKPPKPFKAITGSYPEAEANEVIAMLEEVKKRLKKQ